MLKKVCAVILSLIICFSIAGCGSSNENSNNESGGDRTVRIGFNLANASTLDVWATSYNSVFQVSDAIFDRLLDKDPETLELKCNLIEDFPTVSSDGLTYTFKLKEGVKFHDGSELTSDDVEFTFNYFYAKDTASNNTWVCNTIKGCNEMMDGTADTLEGFKKIDDYSFSITLEYPYAAFQSVLATSMLPILPKEAREEAGDQWGISVLIGSGPYKLKEFKPTESITLEVNPDYHGEVPNVDGVEFKHMDSSTALMEWEAGTIDYAQVPSELIQEYSEKYPDNFKRQVVVGSTRLQLNPTVAPLDDPVVRQSIGMSIDRDAIVNGYFKGNVSIINGIIPDGIPGYNADAPALEYNPEKAKQMLIDAGYTNGVEITSQIRESSQDWKQVIQLIKESLAEAGITMNIETLDSATFLDRRGNCQLETFLADWYADYIDGDMYMYSLFHSTFSHNYSTGLDDEWYDSEVEKARSDSNQEERIKIYQELDNYLVNEVYNFVPLYQEAMFELVSDRVSGVYMKKDLLITLSGASISK